MTCNMSKLETVRVSIHRRMDEYTIEYSDSAILYGSENDTTAIYIHVDESPTHTESRNDTEEPLGWVYLHKSSNTGKTNQVIVYLYT